jgi:hypothetical protein
MSLKSASALYWRSSRWYGVRERKYPVRLVIDISELKQIEEALTIELSAQVLVDRQLLKAVKRAKRKSLHAREQN